MKKVTGTCHVLNESMEYDQESEWIIGKRRIDKVLWI